MPLVTPPLALYVHFPWCVRKCPYCDFNSYTLHGELPEERYVEALIRDLESQAGHVRGEAGEGAAGSATHGAEQRPADCTPGPLVSVFLGGGTPSLFSPTAIERVLDTARRHFGFVEDVEVTLEANPGTIERGRFVDYRAAGVNRVSLGAQSFDTAVLAALGRIHSPEDTCRAAEELHASGLHNFNLDLMYALPGQDVRGATIDLERAIALEPAHLSHYQLTLEPGTVFAAAPPPDLPSDDAAADMLAACAARLAVAGFRQYETSAYAREGRRARHNLNYWTFGDYLGIGAGAHGKRTDARGGRVFRTVQTREPRRYVAAPEKSWSEMPVEEAELPFEFMLNALRLTEGFECRLFEERTGLDWRRVAPIIEELEAAGLMRRGDARWMPTSLGSRFLNDLLLRFLPQEGQPVARHPAPLQPHAIIGRVLSMEP